MGRQGSLFDGCLITFLVDTKTTHDCSTFLQCPLCQEELKRGDLQQHLQHELERLTAVDPSYEEDHPKESASLLLMQSPPIKEEMESPSASPVSTDQGHHLERQQIRQQTGTMDQVPISHLDPGLGWNQQSAGWDKPENRAQTPLKNEGLDPINRYRDLTPRPGFSFSEGGEVQADQTLRRRSAADSLNGQAQKLMEAEDGCLDTVVMRMVNPEEDGDMTSEILKARINELTHKLLQRETYRCHVCT
ncbi:hypothetical protein chiPu_0021523, partial [Chiloscyllium punctatum]|nr:hypothetical protein [Chiloscyllium punctatum]